MCIYFIFQASLTKTTTHAVMFAYNNTIQFKLFILFSVIAVCFYFSIIIKPLPTFYKALRKPMNKSGKDSDPDKTKQHKLTSLPKKSPSWRALSLFQAPNKDAILNLKNRIKKQLILHQRDALLTLFTTWSENKFHSYCTIKNCTYQTEKQLVLNRTLKNWQSFRPFVIPVMFTMEEPVALKSRQQGWGVLPVKEMADTGIPVLKTMFLDAISKYNTIFYAFSNGDILFTHSLLETLVSGVESFMNVNTSVLIIGIRTNVHNVTNTEVATWENIISTAQRSGSLFTDLAEDYFITTATYPWKNIPPFVIGRKAYDNWLVYNARKNKHLVIDASRTLLAVHQTTTLGNNESFYFDETDYNIKLVKSLFKEYSYTRGRLKCIDKYTKFKKGSTVLNERICSKRCRI